jgi:uncharacterized DUF497 family protein
MLRPRRRSSELAGWMRSVRLTLDETTAEPYPMEDGSFEWDEDKAASNAAKHGVRFEAARSVFDDPFAIEYVDDRQDYGEDRFILIGMASGRLLTVVYTMRAEAIRIISARGAEPYEQRAYHEQNR